MESVKMKPRTMLKYEWQPLNEVVVGFEIGQADEVVLNYLNMFVGFVPVVNLHFVHLIPPIKLYYDAMNQQDLPEWGGLSKQALDEIRRRVRGSMSEEWLDRMSIDIRVGDAFDELLHDATRLEADLVVIGQSATKSHHSVLASKLARSAQSNVLVIPEYSPPSLSKILVPVDFSELSGKALQLAVSLSRMLNGQVEVHCATVYDVPAVNWARIQRSENEMVAMLKKDRQQALEKFIEDQIGAHNDFVQRTLIRRMDGSIGKHITDHAESNGFDMIMIGAKGHSPVVSLLLGSVAEKVLTTSDGVPVMVVR